MRLPSLLAALLALFLASPAFAAPLAPTPPMGWNSWDAYGFTIDEAHFKANASVLAGLKSFGWTYAVIDEGWYMADPLGDKLETRRYLYDGYGRLMPVASRFPSAAGGARAEASRRLDARAGAEVRDPHRARHSQGGGRGQSADRRLSPSTPPTPPTAPRPALGTTPITALPTMKRARPGIDSLLAQYAAWGVDFLKVDCIADHPYRPTEISQIAARHRKSGRPIVLSLSPGPAPLAHADGFARDAQMWRIADDLWDGWTFPHPDPTTTFPNGILSAFDNLAKWNPLGAARPLARRRHAPVRHR